MKLKSILLSLLMLLTSLVRANAENFDLTYETLSVDHVLKSSKYKKLDKLDSGHHKTLVRIHKLPDASTYTVKWESPLLMEGGPPIWAQREYRGKFSKKMLLSNGALIGEDIPVLFISSRGFLPGEKVTLTLATEDEKSISQPIMFSPNPIIKEVPSGAAIPAEEFFIGKLKVCLRKLFIIFCRFGTFGCSGNFLSLFHREASEGIAASGEAKLKAELISLVPITYELILEGVRDFEKLRLHSFSSGEELDHEFCYKKNACLFFSPGVLGGKGGFSDLLITRQKGDQFKLALPWGAELNSYVTGESLPLTSDFTPIRG